MRKASTNIIVKNIIKQSLNTWTEREHLLHCTTFLCIGWLFNTGKFAYENTAWAQSPAHALFYLLVVYLAWNMLLWRIKCLTELLCCKHICCPIILRTQHGAISPWWILSVKEEIHRYCQTSSLSSSFGMVPGRKW